MLNFFAGIFYQSLRDLRDYEKRLETLDLSGNPFLNKGQVSRIHRVMEDLQYVRKHTPFLDHIFDGPLFTDLSIIIPDTANTARLAETRGQLTALRKAIEHELWMNVFLYIPRDDANFYEGIRQSGYMLKHRREQTSPPDIEMLFGQGVHDNFPSARQDVNEAGNCYATGRDTACVFHCMRSLEHALRALAKKLRVKLPKNLRVDLAEWAGLIQSIESEISKIEQAKRTARRDKALEFYHSAAAQFRHFKNAWRNHVMHSRASYDHDDAERVMRHVREFMQHLAANGLKEPKQRRNAN